MSAIERGLDTLAFLTEHLREVLRRRLRECCGMALITLAAAAAIALATWSVNDPSFSHATSARGMCRLRFFTAAYVIPTFTRCAMNGVDRSIRWCRDTRSSAR